jgi:hypothetical protein
VIAPNQNRAATIAADGRCTERTISGTVPHPVVVAASSSVARRRTVGCMGFHHVAFASKNTDATHRFYTEAMGFALEKVVVGASPEGGWAKHFFYDTGDDSLIAF